jgi:Tfp pilus assembly protein PilE
MPFIRNYNEGMKILTEIDKGTCKNTCKTIWIRNLKYALKTKTNPLALNPKQRKNITKKINSISLKKNTTKKYTTRKSPPYSANKNCNKIMIGNDGKKYISKANKNNICSWKKI